MSNLYEKQHQDAVGCAMWALVDYLKALGHPFATWPDEVKHAFSEAIIDRSPMTDSEIRHAHSLALKLGWELIDHDVQTCSYCAPVVDRLTQWARENHDKAAGLYGHAGDFEHCPYPTCRCEPATKAGAVRGQTE